MVDEKQICSKISDMYPDIEGCGRDMHISFDDQNQAWVIDLEKDGRRLKTFLDMEDAQSCIEDGRCVGLAYEIAQLRVNISDIPH